MSDFNDKVSQIADIGWIKLVSRVAIPIIAFVGASAWNDLKDQGKLIQQVLINQASATAKIDNMDKRIDNLEDWQKQITYKGTAP